MSDMRELAQDPAHRRILERLLYLAALRGDTDLVAERLGWGVDPNCSVTRQRRTPLIANVRGNCPSLTTVDTLLGRGADPAQMDLAGLTALDYAKRKLARLQLRPRPPQEKSRSLDENDQLRLGPDEQAWLDEMRRALGPDAKDFVRVYWKERLRAAQRTFNDIAEVEHIVDRLEPLPRE